MAGQFGGMLIMLPCIYLMNKIDFTDPENILKLRITYAVVHAAIFVAIGMIYLAIKKANDRRPITIPAVSAFGQPDPSQPPTQSTVYKHDMDALKKLVQQNVMSCVISGFLHFKFGIVPPLFIQSVMNPYQTYQAPLVKLHILGDRSPELVNRPWKQENTNPLASLLGGGQQEPTAATAAATTAPEPEPASEPEAAPVAETGKKKKKAHIAAAAAAAETEVATKQLSPEEAEKQEEKLKVITPQLKEEEAREHELVESGEADKVVEEEVVPVVRARSNNTRAPPPVRLTPSPTPAPEDTSQQQNGTKGKGGKKQQNKKQHTEPSPAPAVAAPVVAEEVVVPPAAKPEKAAAEEVIAEEVAAPADEAATEVPAATTKPEMRKKKPRRDD